MINRHDQQQSVLVVERLRDLGYSREDLGGDIIHRVGSMFVWEACEISRQRKSIEAIQDGQYVCTAHHYQVFAINCVHL